MIKARLQNVTQFEQQSAPRRLLNLGAGFRGMTSDARDVKVIELTMDRCRVTPADELRVGAQAWLKLPNLEAMGCSVESIEGADASCVFHRALHPSDVELVKLQARASLVRRKRFGQKT